MTAFEELRDSPEAPFYRSGATSPEKTWAEVTRRLEVVLDSATTAARGSPANITVERVCGWHRAIFLTTFPDDAGRVRRDDEQVSFAIPLALDGVMTSTPIKGAAGRARILELLGEACDAFNRGRLALQARASEIEPIEGAALAGELFARIVETHPFVDGNHRTAYVALQAGLVSLGLPAVRFGRRAPAHDECLGWAIRHDERRTIESLAELLVGMMK
jgi:Fic/DOC family